MSLLSDGDIANMRDTLDESLPSTAYRLTRTLASDGQGGRTQTWGTAGTVSCRLSPASQMRAGAEEVHGDRVAAVSERMITLPGTAVISITDRLVVGSQTFEVTAIHAPRSWQISTRVDCVEID